MSLQRQSNQYYIAVDGFLVFFYALLQLLSLPYCLYQPLIRLPSSSVQAQALTPHYSSSTFSTYFPNISSLLQGYQFFLLQGTLGSLYSLFRRVLIYFITLELRSFYTLYITAALIYNYRGGNISFLLKQYYSHSLISTYYTLEVG